MKDKMHIFFVFVSLFLIFVCGCSVNLQFPKNAKTEQNYQSTQIDTSNITSYQSLVATCKPAVVGIVSTYGRYQSIGSGVCVKNGSYVLTNNHVVENGGKIYL